MLEFSQSDEKAPEYKIPESLASLILAQYPEASKRSDSENENLRSELGHLQKKLVALPGRTLELAILLIQEIYSEKSKPGKDLSLRTLNVSYNLEPLQDSKSIISKALQVFSPEEVFNLWIKEGFEKLKRIFYETITKDIVDIESVIEYLGKYEIDKDYQTALYNKLNELRNSGKLNESFFGGSDEGTFRIVKFLEGDKMEIYSIFEEESKINLQCEEIDKERLEPGTDVLGRDVIVINKPLDFGGEVALSVFKVIEEK